MAQDQDIDDDSVDSAGMLFRVIAGVQRGAEMALQPGIYLIGSGDDCDIVLADDLVAKAHFAIEAAENELTFTARDGAVAVGERLLQPGEEMISAAPVAISIGQTGLGVGAPGTDWSELQIPDLAVAIEAAEATLSAESEPNNEQTEDVEFADDEVVLEPDGLAEKPPQVAEETVDASSDRAVDRDGRSETGFADGAAEAPSNLLQRLESKWRVAAAAALALVMAATTLFMVRGAPGVDARIASGRDVEEPATNSLYTLRALINDAGITEVDLSRHHTGGYRLSGYVADEAARVKVHSILHDAKISFRDQARQIDEIMRAVQFSLENYQWPSAGFSRHLSTGYVGGGVFAVEGYLGPEVDRTNLNRQIMADAPGVVRVDFKRARLADWRAELEQELERARLKPWIRTDLVEGTIRVSGEITPKEADAWRSVGERFVEKSRGWPKLTIAVRAAGAHRLRTSGAPTPVLAASASAPRMTQSDGFNIIGVIIPSDGPGRVLLDNGMSRAEGETLYDGAVLRSVSLNKVIIQKSGEGVEFRVGEKG